MRMTAMCARGICQTNKGRIVDAVSLCNAQHCVTLKQDPDRVTSRANTVQHHMRRVVSSPYYSVKYFEVVRECFSAALGVIDGHRYITTSS